MDRHLMCPTAHLSLPKQRTRLLKIETPVRSKSIDGRFISYRSESTAYLTEFPLDNRDTQGVCIP